MVSYSMWRDDDDYNIDWAWSAEYIHRFVDSVDHPYAGASAYINDRRVRITNVRITTDHPIANRTPGKILFLKKGIPTVVCGSGLLEIIELHDDASGESLLPLKSLRTRFN